MASVLEDDQVQEAVAVLPSLDKAGREKAEGETEPIGDLEENVRPLVRVSPPRVAPRRFEVLQRWEGTVVETDGHSLWAELHDLSDGSQPVETVEISLAEISDGDRPLVQEGGVFYWHIGYEKSPGGQIRRVSEIRMRRNPAWSRRMIEQIQVRAREMVQRMTGNGETDASCPR